MKARQLACTSLLVAGLAAGCSPSETAPAHTAPGVGNLAAERTSAGESAGDSADWPRRQIAETMPHTMCRSLDTSDPQTAPEHIIWLPPTGRDLVLVRNQALEDNDSLLQTLRSAGQQSAFTAASLWNAPNFTYGTPSTVVSDTGDRQIALEQVHTPCRSIAPAEMGALGIGECLIATITQQGTVTVDRSARNYSQGCGLH